MLPLPNGGQLFSTTPDLSVGNSEVEPGSVVQTILTRQINFSILRETVDENKKKNHNKTSSKL